MKVTKVKVRKAHFNTNWLFKPSIYAAFNYIEVFTTENVKDDLEPTWAEFHLTPTTNLIFYYIRL